MKCLYLLYLLIIISGNSFAQVITVFDRETNAPLEIVTITSNEPKAITTTNNYGQADISSFNSSERIMFQLIGYKKVTFSYSEIHKSNFIIYLFPSNISLEQVIISATKWKQSNKELPSRISVISPKDIEVQNPQTAADLLNLSGEVYIQKSQQGGGSPMIRGFATNRILISVDGIRMNNAIFRSGNVQNVISLDPFTVENTEIIFGPGSIIYGSDAIGGSMNFYTLTPQFTLKSNPITTTNLTYRFSSSNLENTGHLDFNLGWKNFAMLSSITFNSFGDLVMGSNGPDEYRRKEFVKRSGNTDTIVKNKNELKQIPSNYSQLNLMQKIRYSPNDNIYIDYGFHYSRTSDYDRYDRLIRYTNNLPRSAEWYYGPQVWMMNNLSLTLLNNNLFYDDFIIRAAYQLFEESRNDRDFNDVVLRQRKEEVNAYSLNLDLNKRIDLISKFSYGAEIIFNDVISTGKIRNVLNNNIEKASSRYPKSEWLSVAAYFIYQRHLSDKLFLQTGLRYNNFSLSSDFDTTFYPFSFTSSKLSNGAITGSLGFVYTPDDSWILGFNLSSGFRSPNVDDVGKVFDSEPGSVVVPNPDLDAEYAYNAEINIAKVFNDKLIIDASAYYTYLDNALVRRDFQFNGVDSIFYDGEMSRVQAVQNAARAYIWGIQSGFKINILDNLTLSAKFNYQKGKEEIDDGNFSSLRHAAPLFGNAHITYKEKNMFFDCYLIYNGEISYNDLAEAEKSKEYIYALDDNGNPYSPSWYTLNFKISYNVIKQLLFTTGIENITDQRYKTYSSGIASAGRNFFISAKLGI